MTAAALEGAADLVDDQRGQGLAVDFFADDEDRLAGVQDLFQDRHQVLVAADLLFVDEDVGVFELAFHLLRVGDEIRRQVAAVELHAFDEFVAGLERLAFFDGDDAVFADLVHGLGDDAADFLVVVAGDGGDGLQLLLLLDLDAHLLEALDDVLDGLFDAAFHEHGIAAGHDGAEAFIEDRLGKDGRRGGAVAGHVAGLGSDFADHPGAHVLVLVFQLKWSFIGRWNYSLVDAKTLEGVLGFEYNGDCWAFRIVGQRLTTTTEQASKSVFVQFELNGLARLGTNPIDVLKRSVPGYLTGNEPSMRPAGVAATDYFPEF